MNTFKIKNLEIYTVAFSKSDALLIFLINKMGITIDNVQETDIEPNRDAIGKVFRSLEDLLTYQIEY